MLYDEKHTGKEYTDFGENKDTAKDQGQTQYGKWENKLTDNEKTSFYQYTADSVYVNAYLKGNTPEDSKVIKQIEYMDEALNETSVPQYIYVYRRTNVSELKVDGITNNSQLRNPDGSLNQDTIQTIADKFTNNQLLPYDQFINTSVSQDPSSMFLERPILFHLQVPAGEEAGYIADVSGFPDEVELLIEHGYTLQITGGAQILEKGIWSLKLDAKLIPK